MTSMQSSPSNPPQRHRRVLKDASTTTVGPAEESVFYRRPFQLYRKASQSTDQTSGLGRLRILLYLLTMAAVTSFFVLLLFAFCNSVVVIAFRNAVCSGLANTGVHVSSLVTASDRVAESAAENRRPLEWAQYTTLVMVAGHAIYRSTNWDNVSLRDEQNWLLEPFQKGQVSTLLKHIEAGVQNAANDSSAILLFSGGQTRGSSGPRSEALTYWSIAKANHWYGRNSSGIENRTFAEEYARDSFENVLFSICRFHQITGRYPRRIKVVSFAFKRDRFITLHRRAIRFPFHRFEYIGIDPSVGHGFRGVAARERSSAMGPFLADPYGCNSRVLVAKREQRNPYLRYHPYPQGCPELRDLFFHCSRSWFTGPLPWDPRILA